MCACVHLFDCVRKCEGISNHGDVCAAQYSLIILALLQRKEIYSIVPPVGIDLQVSRGSSNRSNERETSN